MTLIGLADIELQVILVALCVAPLCPMKSSVKDSFPLEIKDTCMAIHKPGPLVNMRFSWQIS